MGPGCRDTGPMSYMFHGVTKGGLEVLKEMGSEIMVGLHYDDFVCFSKNNRNHVIGGVCSVIAWAGKHHNLR